MPGKNTYKINNNKEQTFSSMNYNNFFNMSIMINKFMLNSNRDDY